MQQITDIYAECSIDYDPKALTTKEFYAMVQNKFHYAITGRTAAEIIYHSADHTQEHMGLTTWKNLPEGRSNYPKFSNSSNGRCRHVAREVKFDKISLQQD